MTTRTAARLAEIAADHLDSDAARRWLALLRRAVQLVPAGPGDPVVARLGGTPELPPGTEWLAAGTAWEPATCLYWLARTDGAGPLRVPDDIGFTWQCG